MPTRQQSFFEKYPEYYETILETLQSGINIVDPEGKILFVNKTYCNMHGFNETELIGNSIAKILPDEDPKAGLINFKKIVRKKIKKSFVVKSFNRKKDGALFPVILAWNYLLKNEKLIGMVTVVQDITEMTETKAELEKSKIAVKELREKLQQHEYLEYMMGDSITIKETHRAVEKVANTDFSVMISGETGTGKEIIAKAIHSFSDRNAQPLISVDCGAIPDTLIESELFGHLKGAFTGADRTKEGAFQKANRGTIFLDEITNLSVDMQKKLLRVLETKEVQKIGSQKKEKLDFRIISASNENIENLVNKGNFRKDLFFRLNEFFIRVPTLHERKEDIPILTQRFIGEICQKLNMPPKHITEAALNDLIAYEWPGNVRELRNSLKRAIVISEQKIIPEHFEFLGKKQKNVKQERLDLTSYQMIDLKKLSQQYSDNFEKKIIRDCLINFQNNKSKTARFLQIDYKTLLAKIKKYGIDSR